MTAKHSTTHSSSRFSRSSRFGHSITRLRMLLLCWLFWLPLCQNAFGATANSSRTVIVIHHPGYDALAARLSAELEIAGLDAVKKEKDDVPSPADIEKALETAVGFVFVRELTQTLELYYRTQNRRVLHLMVPLPSSSEEEQLTSLHIAEVLRVTLPQEMNTPAPPLRVQQPPKPPPALSDIFTGQMMLDVLWADTALSPMMGITIGGGVQFNQWLGISLFGSFPIKGIKHHMAEGNTTFLLGGGGALLTMFPKLRPVTPFIRIGWKITAVRASVDIASNFSGDSRTDIANGFIGIVGGALQIYKRFGLELSASVSPFSSALTYQKDGEQFARIGHPLWAISVGPTLLPRNQK